MTRTGASHVFRALADPTRMAIFEELTNPPAPMVDWLHHYGAFWRDRFVRLESLSERVES